ncbi:MAG: hypothetical protein CSA74_02950 [Rhodobacterales bacterium]|nr:MAG: hypothetical protein CSA74_02950 [Rhodobacterales bacterium]
MQLCRPYIYLLSAIGALFLVGLHVFTRVEIHSGYWQPDLMVAAETAVLVFLLARARGKLDGASALLIRILKVTQGVFEGILMIASVATVLRLLDHATKTFDVPLADEGLARADTFLGLPWRAYFEWVHDHPDLHPLMEWAYTAIDPATVATIALLPLIGSQARMKAFVEAFLICAMLSIMVGAFFPARAAVDYLIGDLAAHSSFIHPPGVYHLEAMDELRAPSGPIVVGDGFLPGMTTFPSLHTGIGVLILLAGLGTRLWLPAMAYAALMISATPIWGGHYFVDLIAGAALAVPVWVLVCRSLSVQAFGKTNPSPPDAAIPAGGPAQMEMPLANEEISTHG